jgi:thiamine-monophosphate kinase
MFDFAQSPINGRPGMETKILQWLREYLPTTSATLIGPGDDAALLDWSDSDHCLVATDTIVEGLDFVTGQSSLAAVGRKALAINLSDLAAMGAIAVSATASLVLPAADPFSTCRKVIQGMHGLAKLYEVSISGGDISIWDGPLVATVTALGRPGPGGVLTRDGAHDGDQLLVTGRLGGSILSHHHSFTPRLNEIIALTSAYQINAAIDISDGLTLDLFRLAEASGLAATIYPESIPISPAAQALSDQIDDSESALQHALADGEDFELLLAVSPDVAETILREQPIRCGISGIGCLTAGRGLFQRDAQGSRQAIEPRGYVHGSGEPKHGNF